HRSRTYVDVGAGHPVYGSNTFGLYLQGWRGVTVEPNPDHARKHRAVRPHDQLMQVGIAITNSALTYHSFTNPDYNTFDETARDRAISHGGEVLDTHTIPVRRLDRMLTDAGLNQSIDLMSVDCEGLDLDVLRSNDWLKFRPRLLLVEDLEAIDSPWQESDINKYLDGIGYRRWTLVGYTSVFLLKGE
ncbi:MAG: FkbM family methyltransferase, partial [Pseudomonadota bacterium]